MHDKSSQPDFWSHIGQSLENRRALGLNRKCKSFWPLSPTTISRDGIDIINFGSNDYLGLSWHPEVVGAALQVCGNQRKFGSGASPLVTGHSPEHEDLLLALSEFEGRERAMVFSSGYAANVGTVAALATKEDIVFSDSLNHASLIDGCRLSRAIVIVYPHCDMAALRELVQKNRHRGRFAFIVTDSVFSMDGDLAPLREIDLLCHEYNMQCLLDEAHATGVYGQNGQGLSEHLGLTSDRVISIGTLSKALGCAGGFVTGSSLLIDWLTNHARSWIYSTATTIPNAVAASKAVRLAKTMHVERHELAAKSTELRGRLESLGFEVGTGDSPIVPIYIHDTKLVSRMSEQLLEHCVYVPAIRPPTVPENSSLLRVSLSALHSRTEIDHFVNALAKVG